MAVACMFREKFRPCDGQDIVDQEAHRHARFAPLRVDSAGRCLDHVGWTKVGAIKHVARRDLDRAVGRCVGDGVRYADQAMRVAPRITVMRRPAFSAEVHRLDAEIVRSLVEQGR